VYGPVQSWRFGRSLGIDLLFHSSICSFNCIYCQLGRIQRLTTRQAVFVPTEHVFRDLERISWDEVDAVTFSGSGEPTLALNLGEVIDRIKDTVGKPVIVLTNSTLFGDEATRRRVLRADRVVCKLDAARQEMLEQVNRPAPGVSLDSIVAGIRRLRDEFHGTLALQCMFMPVNHEEAAGIARLAATIRPDELQINTPRRPHPRQWNLETRGAREVPAPPEGTRVPVLPDPDLAAIEDQMRHDLPGVRILTALRHEKT